MTNSVQPTHAAAPAHAQTGMRGEIMAKWGKFTAAEIAGLKDKDDLVAQIQSKYSQDKAKVQSEVDAFARGRPL